MLRNSLHIGLVTLLLFRLMIEHRCHHLFPLVSPYHKPKRYMPQVLEQIPITHIFEKLSNRIISLPNLQNLQEFVKLNLS
jgi:hypothetical protein